MIPPVTLNVFASPAWEFLCDLRGAANETGRSMARTGAPRPWTISALLGLLVVACAQDPGQNRAWSLEGRPGLLAAIKQYYQQSASEDSGRCRNVLMEGVSGSELMSEDEDRLVVNVRYRYRSASGSERGRGCGGFGERTFEATRTGDRYEVVSMSGDRDDRGLRWRIW